MDNKQLLALPGLKEGYIIRFSASFMSHICEGNFKTIFIVI